MKRKISKILVIVGLLMLLTAGVLFVNNRIFDYRAGQLAQELLNQMMSEVDWDLPPLDPNFHYTPKSPSQSAPRPSQNGTPNGTQTTPVSPVGPDDDSTDNGGNATPVGSGGSGSGGGSSWVMPSYSTIGIISIPKLGVRLPVISECTDDLLRISCCRLSGAANNRPNRLVITGHNIWSHFKGLDTFVPGDQVAFTDKDGVTYFYSATEIVVLHRTQGAEVLAATGWDLTLITCRTDRTMRTVVRFAEIRPAGSEEPTETPTEEPAETPGETPTEDPAVTTSETPVEGSVDRSVDGPVDGSVEGSTEDPSETPPD